MTFVERIAPDEESSDINPTEFLDHIARYKFAGKFVKGKKILPSEYQIHIDVEW